MRDYHTSTVSGAAAAAAEPDHRRDDHGPDPSDYERCNQCDEWSLPSPHRRTYWTTANGEPICVRCASRSPRTLHYGPDGAECHGNNKPRTVGVVCSKCDAAVYVCGCGIDCDLTEDDELGSVHGCLP